MSKRNRNQRGKSSTHSGSPKNGNIVNGKVYKRCFDFKRDTMEQLVNKLFNFKYQNKWSDIMNLLIIRIKKGGIKYQINDVLNYIDSKIESINRKKASTINYLNNIENVLNFNTEILKMIQSLVVEPVVEPVVEIKVENVESNVTINIYSDVYGNVYGNFYSTST